MKHPFLLILFVIYAFTAVDELRAEEAPAPAGTYTLDKSHASLTFGVSHMGFSHYTMTFDDFDVTLQIDPTAPEKASVKATIDPRSLDLPSPPKGFLADLLGDKWLKADQFPEITFVSDKVERTGENTANVHGQLTLLGVSKPITLQVAFNGGYKGIARDPRARIGFSAAAHFNRSDFGMSYGIPEPGSAMGVGDTVRVMIEAELSGPELAEGNHLGKPANK